MRQSLKCDNLLHHDERAKMASGITIKYGTWFLIDI